MSLFYLLRRTVLPHNSVKVISNIKTSQLADLSCLVRNFSVTKSLKCTATDSANNTPKGSKPAEEDSEVRGRGKLVENIPVETSVRYLQSKAYSITYGTDPVWKNYRRNFKGTIPPRKTRKTCIRSGKIATGNPCPICRDDYLVLDPQNTELLKQFISPHTGETLHYSVTSLCRKQQKKLLSAIYFARDKGAITYDVPFRSYDYSEYQESQ